VEFKDIDAAKAAVKMNGEDYNGRKVLVVKIF
jgi:hypothetical protein